MYDASSDEDFLVNHSVTMKMMFLL